MTDWVQCTDTNGRTIYVNLATAMSVFWNEKEGYSFVAYPGSDDDVLRVKEKPEAILSARQADS
jgi:hypothetical protein